MVREPVKFYRDLANMGKYACNNLVGKHVYCVVAFFSLRIGSSFM